MLNLFFADLSVTWQRAYPLDEVDTFRFNVIVINIIQNICLNICVCYNIN